MSGRLAAADWSVAADPSGEGVLRSKMTVGRLVTPLPAAATRSAAQRVVSARMCGAEVAAPAILHSLGAHRRANHNARTAISCLELRVTRCRRVG